MLDNQVLKNSFLSELLGLQQDGRQAISSPTNWMQSRPLLEVQTELDEIVEELTASCLTAGSNNVGRWHFFVGSPGNGKSAAVGKLVRSLLNERGCIIASDDGTDIHQLASDSIPYFLDVFEPGSKFPSVRIVQDASVVRNPYAADVDPAKDLLDTLEDAWKHGISLVVCTNRGVQEKAFHDTYLDSKKNQLLWHKNILRPLVESANGTGLPSTPIPIMGAGRHPVFDSIRVSASFLDSRSLLLSDRGIFSHIIQQATLDDHWATCHQCSSARLCPFKANRDWLTDDTGRALVVKAFRRAEVLSTQVIVFREALAAISFLLAGCACDYLAMHPCEWVEQRISQGDIFGLAMRRIYMALYSSWFPRGLEFNKELRDYQFDTLQSIRMEVPNGFAQEALSSALDISAPSTDVGIPRLLGSDGVFANLDAIRGPLPPSFFDNWDGNYDRIKDLDVPFISEIERQCADAWYELETVAENMPSHLAADAYWAVRRWSTQFTLHLGALIEDRILAAEHVDEFAELLELLWKDKNTRNVDERRRLRELEHLVERLLNRDIGQGNGEAAVALSENVQVYGRWIEREMRPSVGANPASGSLTIAVRFGGSSGYTTLAAPMYSWLRRRSSGTLAPRCVPGDLLNDAMDAKGRAVAKSSYAFAPDDITLAIRGEYESFTLTRYSEEVDIHVNPQP